MKPTFTYTFLIGFLSLGTLLLKAQQSAFYSQYEKNWQIINPAAPNLAFIQSEDAENVLNIGYRQQWLGLKGSPANYNVHFEKMALNAFDKLNMKFGAGIYGESAGALQNNTIYFNYAYPISMDFNQVYVKASKLYIGFNAGYLHQRINLNRVRFENSFDETVDNILKEQKVAGGQSFFELTPGLFFTNAESFYIGVSSPRLLRTGKSNGSLKVINSRPQIDLLTGYYNEYKTFQTSLWVRWQSALDYQSLVKNSPVSATLNFKSLIGESLTLGLGVSTGRWIHFEGGWEIGGTSSSMGGSYPFVISFSYDLPFYKSGLNLGQTAEINFVFQL